MPRTTSRTSVAAVAVASLLALAACGGHDKKPHAAPSPTLTSASPTTAPPAPKAAPKTCPLTGRVPTRHERLNRPTLAVKIDNVDIGRPQSGINHADIIFEETVEGGLTRLFAVFQCDNAPVIGPVRSARTTDSDLIQLFKHAIFGFSGANSRVNARIYSTPGAVALSYDSNGGLYYRNNSRPAPHNVYTSTGKLVQAGLARNKKLHAPPPLFFYDKHTPARIVARHISLRWSGFASAAWTWTGKVWARTQNGTPDVLVGGHRLSVDNVIVMRIATRFLGLRDVLGNASPDDVITGHGMVWVFRNGRLIRGHWKHKNASAPLRLIDGSGKQIRLDPGHTWVELLPNGGSLNFGR